MFKFRFKHFTYPICLLLVLFFPLISGATSPSIAVCKLPSLSNSDVEMLMRSLPAMKVRTYRSSPEETMLDVRNTLMQANCIQHEEIFEALIKFTYISQVINFQNKITKNLHTEIKELIKRLKTEGVLNDIALLELLKLTSVYDTGNAETLIRIIEAKDYLFPVYKFFAKYLYISIIKDVDNDKKITYENEVKSEAFETWISRSPENIIGNKNSLEAISKALAAKEDTFFDFMHYFNLLYLNRHATNQINFTDDKIEKYITQLLKKFPNNPYFLNNFRIWFLSIMSPGYSFELIEDYFQEIMKTGTNQQKAIGFEHYCKQIKYFPNKSVSIYYLKQVELLIEYLKVEEDYYGLRGIALGYINVNSNYTEKTLKLLKYIYNHTTDIQLKKLVSDELDKVALTN